MSETPFLKTGHLSPHTHRSWACFLLSRTCGAICLGLLLLGLSTSPLHASVQSDPSDDVWPFDDPLTFGDEGLPDLGNSIDPLEVDADPTADEQSNWEGRETVYVGRTGHGTLLISSPSDLRYENLVIGETNTGSGDVRIEGFSAVYNNDYTLLPPAIQILYPNFGSIREQDDMDGFDLYVGQGGVGSLKISDGGAAEIQDAVVVGDLGGSEGTLIVDGTGAFLGNGGYETTTTPGSDESHQIIIGRLGSGTAQILNGGTIFSRGAQSMTGAEDVIGAVIGSRPYDNTQPPDAAGVGNAYVDGIGSTWVVAGNFQVGGFHNNIDPVTGDLDGDDAVYSSNVGTGTLSVSNGGLVTIVSPSDEMGNAPDELNLVIGRKGTVQLSGGRIEMQSGFQSGTDPPDPLVDDIQVINDGLIVGDGSIDTGVFNNRYLGQVRVLAGETLVINSEATLLPPMHRPPLANWGVIEVLGNETARAELEFDHEPNPDFDPDLVFHNYQVDMPPVGGHTEGQIFAQDATLRFESGLSNEGLVSFSAGTNVVSGEVVNEAPTGPGDSGGVIFVSGDNTTVLFEGPVTNNGVLELAPNISLVTLAQDLTMGGSGAFSTWVGGRPTGQEISLLSVGGDIALDGLLEVTEFTAPGVPAFSPQEGDTFEIIKAAGEMTGDFAAFQLPPPMMDLAFLAFPDYGLDAYFITVFSFAAAIGADFDGNGIVDDTDYQIWLNNVGGPGPVGDANLDGIVNGVDFFIWQTQVGGPGMVVPGAGSGSGALGTVPEPASSSLLFCGGMLALTALRRRFLR